MSFIIIRGPLGCGKSSIAKKVTEKLGAEYIAVDEILDEFDLTADKEGGYISQKSFLKANEIIVNRAKGHDLVVLDGNFYWGGVLDDLVEKMDSKNYIFTLKASLDTCMRRDGKRERAYGKEAAKAVYDKATSFDYGIEIDTEDKTVNECVDEILEYFN